MEPNAPATIPAPVSTPPAAAPIASPALPMPAPPAPAPTQMEGGGPTSGVKKFFEGINWLDVAVSGFAIGVMIFFVDNARKSLALQKVGYNDLNARIIAIESAEAARKAEQNAVGKMRKKPIMRMGW